MTEKLKCENLSEYELGARAVAVFIYNMRLKIDPKTALEMWEKVKFLSIRKHKDAAKYISNIEASTTGELCFEDDLFLADHLSLLYCELNWSDMLRHMYLQRYFNERLIREGACEQ